MSVKQKRIFGQQSFVCAVDTVEIAVTRLGGHMAPVTFCRDRAHPVQPYYISPWQTERGVIDEPALRPLRGDFFCMPFGGDNVVGKERHVAHGETATAAWEFVDAQSDGRISMLELRMPTRVRSGVVRKRLSLHAGHNAVYCQHILEGYRGAMCLGHHATLAVPDQPGALRFSTSPIRFGYTSPGAPGPHAAQEYFCLPPGVRFRSLKKVPTIWKTPAYSDRTTFPSEEGFTDILSIFPKTGLELAWNAAAIPSRGYVWFALRDASVLNATVLWMSNKGRHSAPWNGRNRCLGVEDVCAFFANGLRDSAGGNFLNEQGIRTALTLSPKKPLAIHCIQGVARITAKFDRVANIVLEDDAVRLQAESGAEAVARVNHRFITTGRL